MPWRDPSGSVKPPTTNSCRLTHFVFTQPPRFPGRYGWSRRFDTMPSSPRRQACSKAARPRPSMWPA